MILPSHCFGPYASESVSQARIREHQEALDDEWNAPIETARGILEKARADVAQQLRHHPKKDVEAVLGQIDNALGDLPLLRGE